MYSQNLFAQQGNKSFNEIYSLALDGEIKKALSLLDSIDANDLNEKETVFKNEFMLRFKNNEDKSSYLTGKNPEINDLLIIYRNYWRKSFLIGNENYEAQLKKELSDFFNIKSDYANSISKDSLETIIDMELKKYISGKNLNTTGFGKTGKFYDLLVWKSQTDTNYNFSLKNENINCKVVFMEDFITLGWEEYATIGKYYPGGWATKESLYCVKSAYDLSSENFLISYLAHEGRHFEDYKLFPKLSGADLEYRAKLTELSLLKETLFKVLEHFITNSNFESDNAHSVANYCVVRDLSLKLFDNDFEEDFNKWNAAGYEKINEEAYVLLTNNTDLLKVNGADTERFIKK